MSEDRNKLIKLETRSEKDSEFVIAMLYDLVDKARAGKVKQMFIAWETPEGEPVFSACSVSTWSLLGLIEVAKNGLLNREGWE